MQVMRKAAEEENLRRDAELKRVQAERARIEAIEAEVGRLKDSALTLTLTLVLGGGDPNRNPDPSLYNPNPNLYQVRRLKD